MYVDHSLTFRKISFDELLFDKIMSADKITFDEYKFDVMSVDELSVYQSFSYNAQYLLTYRKGDWRFCRRSWLRFFDVLRSFRLQVRLDRKNRFDIRHFLPLPPRGRRKGNKNILLKTVFLNLFCLAARLVYSITIW